jgi:AcrR family transcriptional regulator
MVKSSAVRAQGRGRPSAQLQRHVVDDLLRATDHAIGQKAAQEISVHEISMAVGTSETMIRYYFGGREGLLLEVVRRFMEKSPDKDFDVIADACVRERSIGSMVHRICEFYYTRPNITKWIAVELFSSSSEIKKLFLEKYSHCIDKLIQNVITRLKAEGIYRNDVNSAYVAKSIVWLIVATMDSGVSGVSPGPPEICSGEWANFITQTFDTTSRCPV